MEDAIIFELLKALKLVEEQISFGVDSKQMTSCRDFITTAIYERREHNRLLTIV